MAFSVPDGESPDFSINGSDIGVWVAHARFLSVIFCYTLSSCRMVSSNSFGVIAFPRYKSTSRRNILSSNRLQERIACMVRPYHIPQDFAKLHRIAFYQSLHPVRSAGWDIPHYSASNKNSQLTYCNVLIKRYSMYCSVG